MNRTSIEWTTFSANPLKYRDVAGRVVWGCAHKSAGCINCYSEALAKRYGRGGPFTAHVMKGLTPFLDEDELRHMRTAQRIGGRAVAGGRCFVGDMTDLFGEWVSDELLNRLFSEVLERRQDVTWQLLTKRADRLHRYLSWRWGEGRIPSRNIHVGVSVEDQATADERIQLLLETPAAVRFISLEPQLQFVDLWPWLSGHKGFSLSWVIQGGESGPDARHFAVGWARSVRDQCKAARVPYFLKQMGRWITGSEDGFALHSWLLTDGAGNFCGWVPPIIGPAAFERPKNAVAFTLGKKGGDPSCWPDDLNVREFPA